MNVLLVGGPFDGQERELGPERNLITIEWTERMRSDWFSDMQIEVQEIRSATYERRADGAFHYVPNHPADVGDERPWNENQLTITEELDDRFQ